MSDPYARERRREIRRTQYMMMLYAGFTLICLGIWGIFGVGEPLLGAFIVLCGALGFALGIQRIRRL